METPFDSRQQPDYPLSMFRWIVLIALVLMLPFVVPAQEITGDDLVGFTHDCGSHSPPSGGLTNERLIAKVLKGGEKDLWSFKQSQDLSFCVSSVFGSKRPGIVAAIREASRHWMDHANVEFHYIEHDCRSSKSGTLFRVLPTSRQAKYKARAFFPSDAPAKRAIRINRKFWGSSEKEMRRLMLHELGHVLGFRHEHIHPEANNDCEEVPGAEPITGYDPLSIMHYARCKEKDVVVNYELSEGDKLGAAVLYPF